MWVELPEEVDALKLYHAALAKGISVVPGLIFSASGRFKNHIRISCGYPCTDSIEGAVVTLGKLCQSARK